MKGGEKVDFGNVLLQKSTSFTEQQMVPTAKESNAEEVSVAFKDVINYYNRNDKLADEENRVDEAEGENGEVVVEMNDLGNLDLVDELDTQVVADLTLPEVELETDLEVPSSIEYNRNIIEQLINGEIMSDEMEEVVIDEQLLQQLTQIIEQLNLALQQLKDPEHVTQLAKEIYQLFQRWNDLPLEVKEQLKQHEFMQDANSKEGKAILNELLNLFEKRQSLTNQKIYSIDASISQTDIKKWLQQALERHALPTIDHASHHVNSNQPLQMSATEQYVVQASNTERVDAISRNLVSDVQNIVNRSQFLKQPGLEQLTFTLRPASLGEVTIRLVQVDGTMTVKFLVASQAAKQLFEANLHQLKPMFAPNQVVIERDMNVSDKQFYQEEQEPHEEHEETPEQNEQRDRNENNEQRDVSFEELLQLISEEAIDDAEN